MSDKIFGISRGEKDSHQAPTIRGEDFETAFKSSAIGMAIVGTDMTWLRVNQALLDTLGYTEFEMTRMSFQEMTHPEDLHIGSSNMEALRKGDRASLAFEKRYIHKSGRIIHALVSTAAVRDDKGKTLYLISQIQDISEQKRAELQAKLIVESTFDGYWDWLIQEDYQYMSPRYWEMFGYDYRAKKHHPSEWIEIIFPEDRDKIFRNFELHVQSKGEHPFYQELRFKHSNGSTVWVLCKGTVVEWDSKGRPLRMVGTHTDITDLKNAQQALAQNSKMVALGEMAGGVAHEINNPLTVIIGHANRLRILAEQGDLNPEDVLKACEKLEKTSMRISRIVKGLRIYSRDVENEELKDVLVNELVDDTLSFCIEKFRSRGIEVTVTIPGPESVMTCRPIQISQVLLNLLNNSYDAIKDEKEKWIRIEFRQNEDESQLWVIDSGPGVDRSIREKIMEPFFTTKPVGVGTGLGLSICSGIVSTHGGVLSLIEDAPHTTFCVALPRGPYIQ